MEKQRFSVSLKPSLVASSDAGLLHSLFADLEFAAQLRWGTSIPSWRSNACQEDSFSAPFKPSIILRTAPVSINECWVAGCKKMRVQPASRGMEP